MSSAISAALRRFVEERAHQRCEYGRLPMSVAFLRPHEVDHVSALKHGGATDEANLALACWRCNRHKGTDLTSFDPQTGELTGCSARAHRYGMSISRLNRQLSSGRPLKGAPRCNYCALPPPNGLPSVNAC